MKKTLLLLALFVAFSNASAFAGTHPGVHKLIASRIFDQCAENVINQSFNIELGGNYKLAGTIIKTSSNSYMYTATLTNSGNFVGTVTGSFQTIMVNGVETMVQSSLIESYSNDDAAAVMKQKKETLQSTIGNIR